LAETRTQEETRRALDVQRLSLIAFSESYDKGDAWQAIWLAAATYVIVQGEGTRIASILSQLGIREQMRFLASAPTARPDNLARETPLIMSWMRGDGTAGISPLLGNGPPYKQRWLTFQAWWCDEIIFKDGDFQLNRQRLVFALRNKEGGGHFDREITDKSYLRMSREQITTPQAVFSGQPEPMSLLGAELATMRQIAWELIETLKLHQFLEGERGHEFKIG
jgi:hypothetical protein